MAEDLGSAALVAEADTALCVLRHCAELLGRPRPRRVLDSAAHVAARRTARAVATAREDLLRCTATPRPSAAAAAAASPRSGSPAPLTEEHTLLLLRDSLRRLRAQVAAAAAAAAAEVEGGEGLLAQLQRSEEHRAVRVAVAELQQKRPEWRHAVSPAVAAALGGNGGGGEAVEGDAAAAAELAALRERQAALEREVREAEGAAQKTLDDVAVVEAAAASVEAEREAAAARVDALLREGEAALDEELRGELRRSGAERVALEAAIEKKEEELTALEEARRLQHHGNPLHQRIATLRNERLRPLLEDLLCTVVAAPPPTSRPPRISAAASTRPATDGSGSAVLDDGVRDVAALLTDPLLARRVLREWEHGAAEAPEAVRVLWVRDCGGGGGAVRAMLLSSPPPSSASANTAQLRTGAALHGAPTVVVFPAQLRAGCSGDQVDALGVSVACISPDAAGPP